MKKISAMICIAAFFISLFCIAQGENERPVSGMRVYSAGKYAVGRNLEAGEYILFSAPGQAGSFFVSADREGEQAITQGLFTSCTLLTVQDGEYLEIMDCTAVLAADYYSAYSIDLDQSNLMLKAGVDITPGTYLLLNEAGYPSIYRIYNDSRHIHPVEEMVFTDTCEVQVNEGQYLELVDCRLGVKISENSPEQEEALMLEYTPAPSPAPSPNAHPAPKKDLGRKPGKILATATPKPTPMPTPAPTATAAPTPTPARTPGPAPVVKTREKPSEKPSEKPTQIPTEQPLPTPAASPIPQPTAEQKQEGKPSGQQEKPQDTSKKETPVVEKTLQKVRIDKTKTPVIRSIPSTKGEKVGMAKAGAEYVLLETNEKWYRIRMDDGVEGWVTRGMAEIIE